MRLLPLAIAVLIVLNAVAHALSEAPVAPAQWPHDTKFEFGIYERGVRKATAYYRVLKEQADGVEAYRFKYSGRNDNISEASECLVRADDMRPLRSNRKVVFGGRTFYQDVAYADDLIHIRKRYEGEALREYDLPAAKRVFDYEELLWLIPRLDFSADSQLRFELFSTINEITTTVLVSRGADDELLVAEASYPTRVYTFSVGQTPYKYWLVMQDGHPVPGRVDMGNTSFVNLKLSTKKVTPFAEPKALAPSAQDPPREETMDPGDEPSGTVEPAPGSGDPFAPPPDLG